MTKEHRIAVAVAVITIAVMVFITFFRSGTSW
jgi:hypothetical protein